MEKIKCYELDFGDTNLISKDIKDITDWIANDMLSLENDDQLEYSITIKMMTAKELHDLPDWA